MRISIGIKLIIAFLVIALMVGGMSYFYVQNITQINKRATDLLQNDFAQINALQEIARNIAQIQNEALDQHTSSDANIQTYATRVRDAASLYRASITQEDIADGAISIDNIVADAEKIIAQANTLGATSAQLEPQEAQALRDQLSQDQHKLFDFVDATLTAARQRVDSERQESEQAVEQTINLTVLAAILTTLIAMLLGVITSVKIKKSLNQIRAGAQRIADGNLSQAIQIKSRDELGELATSFNLMTSRLRESYRRLAIETQRDVALLKSMGEGLIALDEAGKVALLNSVAAEILEIDEKTAIGKSAKDILTLYGKEKRPLPAELLPPQVVMQSGATVNDVFGFRTKDKRQILININAAPVVLEEKTVGVILILRDVTKEKEVDRMKTEFISLASHQLRTPLSAIKWFSEMMLSGDAGKLTTEQTDFAQNIADSTERMIQLVNALLNISRIESGRIMIAPQPTDLKELVSGIVNDLKAKTEDKKQTLIISVHNDLPKINIDARMIGQVYLNLLTNAIKYTPKGGEISVFVSRKGEDVISQVTDNGYGIPKAEQGRMFQKFFRATNAAKVETDGTGLGLYLIKAIIESSGGKIWFESEEGKGTTFWFSIPMSGMKAKEGEVTLDM